MTTVSTSGLLNMILQQNSALEKQYATGTLQSSSGLNAATFSGIAPNAQELLNLQSQYNRITAQTTNATAAESKLNSIGGALGGISSLLTNAMSALSAAISSTGSGTAQTTADTMQSALNQLVSTLNTQYGGDYLFSGSATNTAPVDTSATGYNPASAPTTPDTTYYQGNDQTASIKASDTLTVSYGVTANNPAFEQAMRGLAIAIQNPGDSTDLQQAFDLLQQASSGVTTLTAQNATASSQLSDQVNTNTQSLNFIDTNITDLRNVDITSVQTQLSQIDNQLTASFSALSKLLDLNLSTYLR